MKYFDFLKQKIQTPLLKEVLTERGARLMALGALNPYRKTIAMRVSTGSVALKHYRS